MKNDVTVSAQLVRAILKETYPGVKFSVRISRFSGGSSVEIRWTDGPTQQQIDALTARLKEFENGLLTIGLQVAAQASGIAVAPPLDKYDTGDGWQ